MIVLNRQHFDEMWAALAEEPVVGLDTETRGLHWWRDPMCGISLATRERAWYVPFRHGDGPNCPLSWIQEIGTRLAGRLCVLANGNFDWHVLRRDGWLAGERRPPMFHDVQIAAYCLDENQRLKLEELAKRYLGIQGDAAEQELFRHLGVLLGKKKVPKSAKGDMWRLPAAQVAPYAEADALHTRQLLDALLPKIKEEGLGGTYRNLIEYQRVLHDMEEYGLQLDAEALEAADLHACSERDRLMAAILHDSGGVVKNPNSVPQLKQWLGTDGTAKKLLSKLEAAAKAEELDEDGPQTWLQSLPPRFEMLRQFRQWRTASGNYFAKMKLLRDDANVLHAQLRLTGAKVRLSCGGGFNAQAIPRTKEDKPHPAYHGIKNSIVAHPGRQLFEVDYSQAEIVMAAHYSQDPRLLAVINDGLSLHDVTAENARCSRDAAKMLNFMVPYGVGAAAYAETRGISLDAGKAELQAHYETYPDWRRLNFLAINEAKLSNKIKLWSGRTRHFAGHEDKRRTALNVLIQGGVSECLREKTVAAWHRFPDVRFSLTVHDSNIGDMPIGSERDLWPALRACLTDFPWMRSVKMDCELKVGPSWASAKVVANE